MAIFKWIGVAKVDWESVHVPLLLWMPAREQSLIFICVVNGWYSIHMQLCYKCVLEPECCTNSFMCLFTGNDLISLGIFEMRIAVQCAKAPLTKLFQRVMHIIRPWMSSSLSKEKFSYSGERKAKKQSTQEHVSARARSRWIDCVCLCVCVYLWT